MKDDCESYSENTINPFPYSFGVMPSVISSRISNWNDVDTIFGYDGSNWLFYDPDDIDSSTLISLQKGQAFYIDTKSDSGFVLGNQFYGTKCDENDITGRGYTIYNGCNQAYQVCPANTKCSQITPQAKITTPLIEDFTDCSMCWFLNSFANPNVLIWTNCPNNPECRCLKSGLCNSPNVYQTNISSVPFSVTEYTIGCYDPSQQKVLWIINSTGENTTQEALINKSINITAETPSIKSENSIISLGAWINTNLGTAYGSMLIAFICSIFFATTLFFKMEDKKIENFVVPFYSILGGFSLPGVEFFPLWIWLLMTVFTGVMIFWKAKG